MARKRSIENPPAALSSQEEEEDEQNDDEEEETDMKSPVVVEKHNSSSDSEDDGSDNTIPSPNISDFTIKPIINKPGSKRPPLTPESESMKMKKKTKEEERSAGGEEAPIIVLGLPCPGQRAADGKKGASNFRVRSEVHVKSQQLDKGKEMINVKRQQFNKGKEMIDGKSKKLMEKMLEIYIKRNELAQQQTRLLLEELKSEKI